MFFFLNTVYKELNKSTGFTLFYLCLSTAETTYGEYQCVGVHCHCVLNDNDLWVHNRHLDTHPPFSCWHLRWLGLATSWQRVLLTTSVTLNVNIYFSKQQTKEKYECVNDSKVCRTGSTDFMTGPFWSSEHLVFNSFITLIVWFRRLSWLFVSFFVHVNIVCRIVSYRTASHKTVLSHNYYSYSHFHYHVSDLWQYNTYGRRTVKENTHHHHHRHRHRHLPPLPLSSMRY